MLEYMLEDMMKFSFFHCFVSYTYKHYIQNMYLPHITIFGILLFDFTFNVTYIHMVIDI